MSIVYTPNREGIVTRTSNQVTRLHTWHRELMRRLLVGEKLSIAAKALGVSETSAKRVSRSPLFRSEMDRLHDLLDTHYCDAVVELKMMQLEAVEALRDTVRLTERPELRLRAAVEILDRTGVTRVSVTKVEVDKRVLSYEERLQVIQQGDTLSEADRYIEVTDYQEPRVLSGTDLIASTPEDA